MTMLIVFELFIDEFSQSRAPPPHHKLSPSSIAAVTGAAAGKLVSYHDNGLPRMPGAHKGSIQTIENGQYMSVYVRNRPRFRDYNATKKSSIGALYVKMNRCKSHTQTGTSVCQLPLNDIDNIYQPLAHNCYI